MKFNKKEEIGKLRERIIVQSVTRTIGATGYGAEAWSNYAEVWEYVDYKGTNREEVEGGKITALSQIKVICRYRTDIKISVSRYPSTTMLAFLRTILWNCTAFSPNTAHLT